MMEPTQVVTDRTWVRFYQEFADKLLNYQNDRQPLIAKLAKVHAGVADVNFPSLNTKGGQDIDPFTAMGLFNRGLAEKKRRAIIAGIKKEFDIRTGIPSDLGETREIYRGRPRFFPEHADQASIYIDNLWRVFKAALAFISDDSFETRAAFIQAYEDANDTPEIGWKLTTGLYWIGPFTFVSLDDRARWFLHDHVGAGAAIANVTPAKEKSDVPDGQAYLHICDIIAREVRNGECPYPDIPSLARIAYVESERVNNELKANKRVSEQEAEQDSLGNDNETNTGTDLDDPHYGRTEFLDEVYLNEERYDELVGLLDSNKNIILQGRRA